MSSREGHTLLIMLFHKLIKIEVILLVFRRDTSLSLFLVPSTGGVRVYFHVKVERLLHAGNGVIPP